MSRLQPGLPERGAHLAFDVVVSLLAAGCLAGLWRAIAIAPKKVLLDPNEGWNAYHAAAAMAGHGPYPGAASLMTNNYPPLSFYLVGWLGSFIGDPIVAGRILSIVAFLTIAALIAVLIRRFGCNRLEAAFASLAFSGFLLLNSDYVGMDDPQMLGHALQLAGLIAIIPRRYSMARDVVGAALFVLALFVKHSLVALPVAAVIWISLEDRRGAIRVATCMLAFGVAGLILCRIAFGFDILSKLNSARTFSLTLLASNIRDWLAPAALTLVATLASATSWNVYARFCAVYALVSVIVGSIFLGGAGVDANAMFDADIAIAMGSGLSLRWAKEYWPMKHAAAEALLAVIFAVPFLAGLVHAFDPDWLSRDFWLHPMHDEEALARDDIDYLYAHAGPAVCEMPSLCFWAGKPASADVFNLDQQLRTHHRDERPFVAQIEARMYAVLQFDSLSQVPFPPEVEHAIRANYRVDRSNDDGVFLVPMTGS
ncbi:MAG: hypothetical protein ABSD74_11055 [Rhizomicrobium sp.]